MRGLRTSGKLILDMEMGPGAMPLKNFTSSPLTTLSAKSWSTSFVYAVDELQNPSPVQQCCLKVIGIALEGETVSFQIAKGFGYRFDIVSTGNGAHNCHFCCENRTEVENS